MVACASSSVVRLGKRESEFRYNDDEGGRVLDFSVGVQEGKGRVRVTVIPLTETSRFETCDGRIAASGQIDERGLHPGNVRID